MSNLLSLLIVTNSITGGGAEISMSRLFHGLKLRGHKVELCALNSSDTESPFTEGVIQMERKWGSGILQTAHDMNRFRKVIKSSDSEIVLANCELPELYVALLCPRSKTIVCVEHTSRPWFGRKWLGIPVRLILNLRGTVWVTVSRDQTEVWPFRNSVHYIPNAYSIDETSKKNMKISSELIFIGRLNKGKHPEVAAEAARSTNSSITFFGDGPMLNDLRKEFENTKSSFPGFVPNPWQYISNKSVLIVTSDFEGDGMTIVEAIMNGNPILLKDNSDLRRFNFPDFVYFRDLSELVRKIDEIKKKSSSIYVLGKNQKAELKLERELNNVIDKWISLLSKVDG